MGADISLADLYKRAEEQAHPPPPPPTMDREHQQWSTDHLLGWDSQPEDASSVFEDLEKSPDSPDDYEEHAKPKSAPKVQKPTKVVKQAPAPVAKKPKVHAKVMAAKVKKAKVKAVKVKLVKMARAKKAKVAIPTVRLSFSPDSVVPEHSSSDMLESHFFDSSSKTKHTKAAPSATQDLLGGFPNLANIVPKQPTTATSLGSLAGNLLNQVHEEKEKKEAAKQAVIAAKRAAIAKAAAANKAAAAGKKAKKNQQTSMNLEDTVTRKVPSEKKLPPLGAFLGGDDDDDDDF